MDKYKAIPEGYMTVGELAKKMNTTVRTLQYYDKEGLLKPSSESNGGRRLYDDKAMVKLYQIMTLKSIGLSLEDIKKSLLSLDTPEEVAKMLSSQELLLEKKIDNLSNSLKEMKILENEVLQMKKVDFKRYADIIVNLQMKNDFYWIIKHFDDKTMDNLREKFDVNKSTTIIEECKKLYDRATKFVDDEVKTDSDQAFVFAKEFWDFVMNFTNGDINLLNNLMSLNIDDIPDEELKEKQEKANAFIGKALENYFIKNSINPFEEK